MYACVNVTCVLFVGTYVQPSEGDDEINMRPYNSEIWCSVEVGCNGTETGVIRSVKPGSQRRDRSGALKV